MFRRRFLIEALGFIVVAALCAAASNVLAARTRQLSWKADYPNAMKVTRRVPPPISDVLPVADPAAPILALPVATPPSATATPGPLATPEAQVSPGSGAPTPTQQPTPTPTPRAEKVFAPHPDRPYVEITPADVVELHGRSVLFLDARRTDDYEAGHITGARSMPVWEADIDQRVAALYDEGRNQQDPIVIYCSGGNCEDSHMLSQKLWGLGFDNVLVYRDGFPDWIKRGGKVTKGATP